MTTEDENNLAKSAPGGPHSPPDSIAHAHVQESFNLNHYSREGQALKQDQRKRDAPAKYPVTRRHLDEFTQHDHLVPPPQTPGTAAAPLRDGGKILPAILETSGATAERRPSIGPDGKPRPLKQPLSIRPMRFINFLTDGVSLYVSHVLHPSRIPGRDMFSRVYAMGVLPVLIIVLTIVQWGIGLLVIVVNNTKIGAHYYGIFFNDQIALFDETDFVDPEGNDEAVRQLADRQPRSRPYFSYHVASLLLIMSSMAYQRDDKLVAEASKILLDIQNQEQRDKAALLLQESERVIDESATKEFGMRFAGISELKTLGGPFAGLFYNDDAIVLVFKGTSVLAFNEYLLDVTFQRVDASEYLYGEVHKGFYESLFPDPVPSNWYESMTYDQSNPFNTIMETIFETAKIGKQKTGKPVNLWLAGHSLGGALAALVMARLQMTVKDTDPLMNEDKDEGNEQESVRLDGRTRRRDGSRTVLQEMMARFSTDPDLLVLRDCYSVASPKIGDSMFAEQFAQNQVRFCHESPYKCTYWRTVADKDLVPRLPPGISFDPNALFKTLLPDRYMRRQISWLWDEKQEDEEAAKGNHLTKPKRLHSLLDYQHVGQLVKIYNRPKIPTVEPSVLEADLSEDVLRSKKGMQALLDKLARLASISNTLDQVQNTKQNSDANKDKITTTTTTTVIKTKNDPQQFHKQQQQQQKSQVMTAQQIADDIAKAQALYDIDELARLRQPSLLESLLLMVPSLLSHAPAAYQRNLVRARFYFNSFPGTEFEQRLGQWLDGAQSQTQIRNETHTHPPMQTQNGDIRVGAVKVSDSDMHVNVDVDVDVKVKDKGSHESKHALSNGEREPVETETTVTHTIAMHPREQ
ncbi:hypothetical protein EDD11_008764 [Mortierella claussenii]|nr:hypothetical protein EDD11_008764 [Mortierella claussenii]